MDLERGSEGRARPSPRGARSKVNLNPDSTAGELGGAGGRGDGGRAGRGGGRRRGRGTARRRPRAPGAPRRAQAGGRRGGAAPAELLRACQAAVRQRLNPLFKVDQVRVSPRLGHSHCACRCFYLCAWPTLAHGPTACDVMAVLQTH